MEEITPEEFEKLLEEPEDWLSDYNLKLIKEIIGEGFRLEICFNNYDYPLKRLIGSLEREFSEGRRRGYFTKKEVFHAIRWKTWTQHQRKRDIISKFDTNTPHEVIEKTRKFLDFLADAERQTNTQEFRTSLRDAINSISTSHKYKLSGVGIGITSTILRFIDPSKYGIIDINALRSLRKFKFKGISRNISATTYVNYLELITEFGKEFDLSPSETDMALYMHGKKCKRCMEDGCRNSKSKYYCKS